MDALLLLAQTAAVDTGSAVGNLARAMQEGGPYALAALFVLVIIYQARKYDKLNDKYHETAATLATALTANTDVQRELVETVRDVLDAQREMRIELIERTGGRGQDAPLPPPRRRREVSVQVQDER